MVLENACSCECLCNRNLLNANLKSLNPLKYPISGFQTTKRPICSLNSIKSKKYNCHNQKKHCKTNKLGVFATQDLIFDRVFDSFSAPNISCRCCLKSNPNLRYQARQIKQSKNQCCNICMPDAISNRGGYK